MFNYIYRLLHPANIKKAIQIFSTSGFQGLSQRLRGRLQYKYSAWRRDYRKFRTKHQLSSVELDRQRRFQFNHQPVFGVIIPLYSTKESYLRELLESFKAQTYSRFKLFLVDASPLLPESPNSEPSTALSAIVANYQDSVPINYVVLGRNLGISGNSNHGFKLALQDPSITHIALCDHDDYVEPNTFFEYTKYLNQHSDARIIYCDEDIVAFRDDPDAYYVVKPDFNRFLIESCNYVNHFFVCDKTLLPVIRTSDGEYERSAFDGAQDYDLYLRLLPHATFHHIPKILYHWRAAENSTAKNPQNKTYAYEAGERTLTEYLQAQSMVPASVSQPVLPGSYRVDYHLQSQPLVSIITQNPAKAHFIDDFKSDNYTNFEVVADVALANPKSEILFFLDNNLQPISEHTIAQLVGILQRNTVGCVAGQILNRRHHIEHAGLIVGIHHSVGNIFYNEPPAYTYNDHGALVGEYSAVSGSCLMVKKSTYHKFNGFDSSLGNLSDVDFCLRLRDAGLSVVYNPTASFKRLGKSSPKTASPDIIAALRAAHPNIFAHGDPFYNPNLSLDHTDCRLMQSD